MKLLGKDGKEMGEKVSLGIVEAGRSKDFEFTIYNDSILAKVADIKVEIPHKEVEIMSFPSTLQPREKGTLTIRWRPSLIVKQGLHTTIKLSASELYS